MWDVAFRSLPFVSITCEFVIHKLLVTYTEDNNAGSQKHRLMFCYSILDSVSRSNPPKYHSSNFREQGKSHSVHREVMGWATGEQGLEIFHSTTLPRLPFLFLARKVLTCNPRDCHHTDVCVALLSPSMTLTK
jgi:hypothetical protein